MKVKGSFLISGEDKYLNNLKETSVNIYNQFVVLILSSLSG